MRHLLSLLFISISIVSRATAADTSSLVDLPELQRAFVVKVTENNLTAKAGKMFADPENAKDGYLWTTKVIAIYYGRLAGLANELALPSLSIFYLQKSTMLSDVARGALSREAFAKAEQTLEQSKHSYLDKLLAKADQAQPADMKALNSAAADFARDIHAKAVLAASE